MSKLAELIAKMEGFGLPGAIPTVRHNPGDLRHSPHSQHSPGEPEEIGRIDSDEHGWEDLERQLRLYAERGLTLREAIYQFAPPNENNSDRYLDFVARGLGVSPDAPLSGIIEIGDRS